MKSYARVDKYGVIYCQTDAKKNDMKRLGLIVFFVSVAFLCEPVKAQQPNVNYYLTGDTIHGRSPIYLYDWWTEAWLADTSHRLIVSDFVDDYNPPAFAAQWATFGGMSNRMWGELNKYYYTDQPLQIMGIATASKVITGSYGSNYDFGVPFYQEYFRLYDAESDTFQLMAEVPWRIDAPQRYMHIDLRSVKGLWLAALAGLFPGWQNACCDDSPNFLYADIPIQEYYFDSMITVTDSFYIGQTMHWGTHVMPEKIYYSDLYDSTTVAPQIRNGNFVVCPGLVTDSLNTAYYGNCPRQSSCGEEGPLHLFKYRNIIWYDNTEDTIDKAWHWVDNSAYWLNFPIIYVDSLYIPIYYECPQVEELRVGQLVDDKAIILWNTHPDQTSWQLSYGLAGTMPDEGTIINCSIQVGQVMGLDSGEHYDVYVRALCSRDSMYYSEWTGPLDVCLCDTTGGTTDPERVMSAMDALTYVLPNPSSDYVQVLSSFRMSKVEVYGVNGRKMLGKAVDGISTGFSVRDWPADIYIVVIHTPVGNVAKKLVVK